MTHSQRRRATLAAILMAAAGLSGCGGSKVLKEPMEAPLAEPLAHAQDGRLEAALDWVTVRNGPGSWAKNADWDEYNLRLLNHTHRPLRVSEISVIDSMGHRQTALSERKALVKASREVERRYDDDNVEVVAGVGATSLVLAGGTAVATGMSLAAGAIYSSAAAGAALGALALGPVLAVGGISRGINNGRVTKEIRARATAFPHDMAPDSPASVTAFYPLSPSPRRVEIAYEQDGRTHVLAIDTGTVLNGLHLSPHSDQ